MNTRRDFLKGTALMGAAAISGGCVTGSATGTDSGLSVFISDLHVSGFSEFGYTNRALERTVGEILAMRPRPRRVVCFGDIARSFGLDGDYAAAKPILARLESAGIELHLTMGNHDRRSSFLKQWPNRAASSEVPGRFVSVIDLGGCDLVLLDTLKGSDDRALDDMGPVEGTIDPPQLAWLKEFVRKAKRPFFIGSHQYRDLFVPGTTPASILADSPWAVGWIYGHDHVWCPDVVVGSWKANAAYPTLALPSTGLWGDIGYVMFRTDGTGATAQLVQRDFYFATPTAIAPRPAFWDCRLRDNQGKTVRFAFPS